MFSYFLGVKKESLKLKTLPALPLFQHANVFIHGTNSSILALLDKTEMQLISPIEMIRKYQIAPLSGEINGGGLERAGSDTMPCFGLLHSSKSYSLEHIIKNYAVSKNHSLNLSWDQLHLRCFTDINVFLISLTRAKQLGNQNIINDQDKALLFKQINGTIQFFYLVLLLGKYIHPNFQLLEMIEAQDKKNTIDAVYTHLNFKNLLTRIMEEKINIQAIYENPSPSALGRIENLLQLPKKSIVKSGSACIDKEVTLPYTNVFSSNDLAYPKCSNYYEIDYFSYRFPQNIRRYAINDLLEKFVNRQVSQKFFRELEPNILSHIEALKDRFALTKIILEKEYKDEVDKNNTFYQPPFPIIFICENVDKISIINFFSDEYRANAPLRIGEDIKIIATDTTMHQTMLKKYFKKYHIDINVILFDQLKNEKEMIERQMLKLPIAEEKNFDASKRLKI